MQYLGDYALLSLVKDLQHLPSTGRVELLGTTQLALHVYVNEEKVSSLALTVSDVKDSLKLELDEQPKNAQRGYRPGSANHSKNRAGRRPGQPFFFCPDATGWEEFARLNGMPVIALVIRPTGSSQLTAAEAAGMEAAMWQASAHKQASPGVGSSTAS